MKYLTNENIVLLKAMHSDHTYLQMSKSTSIPLGSVRNYLKKLGLPLREEGGKQPFKDLGWKKEPTWEEIYIVKKMIGKPISVRKTLIFFLERDVNSVYYIRRLSSRYLDLAEENLSEAEKKHVMDSLVDFVGNQLQGKPGIPFRKLDP